MQGRLGVCGRAVCAVVVPLFCVGALLEAQGPRTDPPPRTWALLAMRAKITDSVAVQDREWRAAAAAAPEAVAPRFALALLARYDLRYGDAAAWMDSAVRVSTTAQWRSAVARERIVSRIVHGELTGLTGMVAALQADSAAIPAEDWADARYVRMAARRRAGGITTSADLDAILAIASPDDALLTARVGCLRAVVDPSRMLEHATAGIAAARSQGAEFIAGNCELVVGTVFAGRGDMASSQVWLERAEQTARAAHDLPTLAQALYWHGANLVAMGYVPWARARLAEAIRVAQRIEDRNVEAWSLLGISRAARLISDATTASTALRRAAILFEATGDLTGAAAYRVQQAAALMQLGDLSGAATVAARAAVVSDSLATGSVQSSARLLLADIALRQGRLQDASLLLDTAATMMLARSQRSATVVTEYRGLLALRSGENAAALALLQTARLGYGRSQDLYRRGVDAALALAHLRLGDTTRAARWLGDANDAMDRLRDSIASDGLRRVSMPPDAWGGSAGHGDQVIASLVRSRRWLPTAFALTERTRARALQKGAFGIYAADTTAAVAEARRRVTASATSLSMVQRSMRPNTAMLVYAGGVADAPTSLMLITRTRAQGFALAPLDSLGRDIVRWLALLESGAPGQGAGRKVSQAILASAMRVLPSSVTRLIVVPQGPLYRVPFQALPTARGVLGDQVVVTISPSVSLALRYAADPRAVAPRVLAFGAGDTDVPSATPATLELSIDRSVRSDPLAPLTAAPDEARAAAAWGLGSLALTGNAASESALKREAAGNYTVLHAAAHALTSDQALGANWLILRADSLEDGYVSGGELATLSVSRAMVVLSGCRTTGDFGSRGDAIDGLVAPLLARGVRTVVASHWAVSDRMTKTLMERFYQQLARGATASEAMNVAQTSLRRSGVPARYWAAFSVIGDGDLTFSAATPVVTGR